MARLSAKTTPRAPRGARALAAWAAGLFVAGLSAGGAAAQGAHDDAAGTCLWHERASAALPRVECASVVHGGLLYNFSGFHDLSLIPSVSAEVYDPETDAWSPIADTPRAVTHAGFADDGEETIWLVGGFIGQHPGLVTDETWLYHVPSDTWSPGPPLPGPRGSGAMARFGRTLHFFGGVLSDRNTDSADHWALDLDGPLIWEPRAPVPTPRNHASAAVLDGWIYYVGGQFRHDVGPLDIDIVERYDPATDAWEPVASLPFPRSHFEPGTFVMDGRIVIVGGRSNVSERDWLPDVTAYDPLTDAWTPLTPLKHALFAPSANALNGEVVVAGGFSPLGPLAETVAMDPTVTWSGELRFSAGGVTSTIDSTGEIWCTDQLFDGGQSWRNMVVTEIAGTDDDALYLTERSGTALVPDRFDYRLPAADGPHLLRLHFAEIYWGAPNGGFEGVGARVFDVFAEGALVLDDLDIYAEVGPLTALTKTLEVDVTGGALDLEFVASADRPKLSGLELIPLAQPEPERYCTAAPNSSGGAASMGWSGTPSLSANDLVLRATGLPASTSGVFVYAPERAEAPLGGGVLCVAPGDLGFVARLSGSDTDAQGEMEHALDLTTPPASDATILAGSTWHFTCWFRDNGAPPPSFNFADGLTVVFRP